MAEAKLLKLSSALSERKKAVKHCYTAFYIISNNL